MSMGRRGVRTVVVMVLLALGLLVAGCGGSSSSSPSSSTSSPSSSTSSPSSSTSTSSEGEPSAQFLKPKGKNTIPKFGAEGSGQEREEASAIVTTSLEAREAGEFAIQCETLSSDGIKRVPGAKGPGDCPAALKKYAEPLSATKLARTNTLSGSIAALRVEGDKGYALYHGNDGKDYAVPLEKEDGAWKVGSVTTIEI